MASSQKNTFSLAISGILLAAMISLSAFADAEQVLEALTRSWKKDCLKYGARLRSEKEIKSKKTAPDLSTEEKKCEVLRDQLEVVGKQLLSEKRPVNPCSSENGSSENISSSSITAIFQALQSIVGFRPSAITKMVLCVQNHVDQFKRKCRANEPAKDLSGGVCTITSDLKERELPIQIFRGKNCEQILIALPQSEKKGAEKEYHQVYEYQTWDTRALGKYHGGAQMKEAEKKAILAVMGFKKERQKGLINTLYIDDHLIIQEYFPDVSVHHWLEANKGKINLKDSKLQKALLSVGSDLSDGLANLHSEGWAHGDIKPHNALPDVAAGRGVYSDLGSASRPEEDCKKGLKKPNGTTLYLPPENFEGNWSPVWNPEDCEKAIFLAQKADVYAHALTIYSLKYGTKLPWNNFLGMERGRIALVNQLKNGDALDQLIAEGLNENPERRPTAAEFNVKYKKYLASFEH